MTLKQIITSLKWRFYEKPIGLYYLNNWRPPKILTIDETLSELLNSEKSLVRFGNGDFDMIWGTASAHYQNYNPELAKRLKEVLYSNNPNILIAISDFFYDNPKTRESEKGFAYCWKIRNCKNITKTLSKEQSFGNTFLSRPYTTYRNIDYKKYFTGIKQLWDNKILYTIEGSKCKIGVGNDLLDNAKEIRRIIAPAENAFDKYDEILKTVKQNIPVGSTIFIALGMTATVLSYDLANLGYRALDFGHLDIEYEYFKRNAIGKMKIPGKYVNEVEGGQNVCEDISDKKYLDSIIAKIQLHSI